MILNEKKDVLRRPFTILWWPGAESNHRHKDFQSSALPTELPGQQAAIVSKENNTTKYLGGDRWT